MFPFSLDFLEIITATIRLDLASDYLGLQSNFRFFTEDCQRTCHSGFLGNSCILTAALCRAKWLMIWKPENAKGTSFTVTVVVEGFGN